MKYSKISFSERIRHFGLFLLGYKTNYFMTKILSCGFIVILFLMNSGFSCKHKKTPIKDVSNPDSITKWNNISALINNANQDLANKNPYKFTDSVRHKEKPKNIFRIAVLGDSFIWGDGVPYQKVWSHKLENKLCNEYQNVEVMSWGLCGWSTLDEYDFFIKEGYKYNIDLLIIGFVENDPDIGEIPQQNKPYNEWQESLYNKDNLIKYTELLKKVNALQETYKMKLLFVITPLCIYKEFEERINKTISCLSEANIDNFDLTPLVKTEFKDTPCDELMATPINGHPSEKLAEFFSVEVKKYLETKKYLSGLVKKK